MRITLALLAVALFVAGCTKEYVVSNKNFNHLVDLREVLKNEECPLGGVEVRSGLDANNNKVLEDAEVENSKLVCREPVDEISGASLLIIPIPVISVTDYPSEEKVIIGELPFFNIDNYEKADSIIFVAKPYVGELGNECFVQLYNRTDGVPVEGSTVSSREMWEGGSYVRSGNIINSFPHKQITISGRAWATVSGHYAVHQMFLYIYEH